MFYDCFVIISFSLLFGVGTVVTGCCFCVEFVTRCLLFVYGLNVIVVLVSCCADDSVVMGISICSD